MEGAKKRSAAPRLLFIRTGCRGTPSEKEIRLAFSGNTSPAKLGWRRIRSHIELSRNAILEKIEERGTDFGSVWGKFGIGLGPFSGVGARKTALGKRFEFGDQPN